MTGLTFVHVGERSWRAGRPLIATPGKPTSYGGPTVMLRYAPCGTCNQMRDHACGFLGCPIFEANHPGHIVAIGG